jgi:hypothetical protein
MKDLHLDLKVCAKAILESIFIYILSIHPPPILSINLCIYLSTYDVRE